MRSKHRLRARIAALVFAAFPLLSSANEPAYSDIKDDEALQFFRTSAWLDEAAQIWHVPVHGWIYEPEDSVARKALFETILENEYGLEVAAAAQRNFARRLNLVIADNERDKTIVLRIAGGDHVLPLSGVNGQFQAVLELPPATVEQHVHGGMLHFSAVTRDGERRKFQGEVRLVPPKGLSVISDIDDTVKITDVTDHTRLLENSFLLDFAAVPGMSDLYDRWAKQGVSFHFVSSSPWQLYAPLQEFLEHSGFPWSTFSLKTVRFRDETLFNLFKKGTETKPAIIEGILRTYPGREFVLVGDSGEQDPEVYAALLRKYPGQIRAAYIRNVTQESADNSRFASLFNGIDDELWQLFEDPTSLKLP